MQVMHVTKIQRVTTAFISYLIIQKLKKYFWLAIKNLAYGYSLVDI